MNKKILKRKIKFLKEPISNFIKKDNHRRNNLYATFYKKMKVVDKVVLYESRDGKSITDSPFAIFDYLLNKDDFKHYKHIWSVENFSALEPVISKYKDYPNVEFVKRNSPKYLKYLATAKYLINNSTFQSFFIPKEEQIYINTWHGTPLKSMGFDIPGNPSHSQNVLRNFLSADYLLSPNEHTTKMFVDSYKLNGIYNGEIIEEGYPRIDLTFNTDEKLFKESLRDMGIKFTNKEVILYAPTWKGTNVSKVKNDVFQIIADMKELEKNIGHKYNILIKVHPYLYNEASKFEELNGLLVPDFVDTNQLLSVTDILITDYSSIFFDYLITDKPILFYMWDADDYNEQRGQYFRNDELPGPILYNIKEVENAINNINNIIPEFEQKYIDFKKNFTNHEDGKVTERIVEYIFKNVGELNVIKNLGEQKEKILIYPGGLMNNGITSSFINLMNNIDYNKYDVSCFMKTPHSKEVLKNINKINKNARLLFKPGLPVYDIKEVYADKLIINRGATTKFLRKIYPEQAYRREHNRLFGNSKFDYVIDFSGYSLYWAKYLISCNYKKSVCFMHNDLLSESEKVINGRKPHRINLRGLFSIYNRFDKLVSVSKGTMELNRKNLAIYADESKFDYVMNSINPQSILEMSRDDQIAEETTISSKVFVINNEKSYSREENNDYFLFNKKFKARANLKNPGDYYIYNNLSQNQKKVAQANQYINEDVTILREGQTVDGNVYYKFSINDSILGWLNKEAFEILPDSILSDKKVNKLAILNNPRGNHIWSKPYKTEGIRKISTSYDFKNIIVDVDKEVRTQHGMYSQIYINELLIGWIDSSALKIIKEYDVEENLSHSELVRINKEKNKLKSKNYKQYKSVLLNLENRTLIEEDKNQLAIISTPEQHIVWSKAYPNMNCKKISMAKEYEGQLVTIIKSNVTKVSKYYLYSINGKTIGWLDYRAFSYIVKPVIIKESTVRRIAKVQLREFDYIWTKPHELEGAKKITNYKSFNHKKVLIVKEVTTQSGTYCKFNTGNKPIGWLDKNAFEIVETLGIEVGNRFIPNPSEQDFNFINMGRLSPEKGQDNLIKAFSEVIKTKENCKLYILGEGVLRNELQNLIYDLNLEDSVYLVGQVENPFKLLKKCDCFVLSSHYEGQPMVLLEAMTLKMKILATDIVANRTVLENGKYGVLVDDSVKGLSQGLTKVMNDKSNSEIFDYEQYNNTAMDSFYKVLN
ncbi:CDP-glycerol glycerophosphotransferase family protein [Bacillus mojavensis]|uniref:CDP-glycerol glycerophosphotransferase family protein n=2 Tax=Bacillus mojavensis TaxID=72360 RepID=UPI002DBC5E9A|nr:CDP-glycerol glycerophosphotransferase family protein [Bacillus mojavensis]MEC1752695.1 CDP-glycerol glycerophosphotransferase family protein [Bacillus mojavensis]